MQLGPHASFIVAAYLVAFAIAAALIVWVIADYRMQRRHLAEFEQRGITRRSSRSSE